MTGIFTGPEAIFFLPLFVGFEGRGGGPSGEILPDGMEVEF